MNGPVKYCSEKFVNKNEKCHSLSVTAPVLPRFTDNLICQFLTHLTDFRSAGIGFAGAVICDSVLITPNVAYKPFFRDCLLSFYSFPI